MKIDIQGLIDEIVNEDKIKYNNYIVTFEQYTVLDTLKIRVKQDINRPNNQDDDEVISSYILDNYGHKDYEIIAIDLMETIIL